MLSEVIHKCLDLLFPRFCLGCGAENDYLCPKCVTKINPCRAPLKTKYCEIILSASHYKNPLTQKIIRRFKYQNCQNLRFAVSDIILRNINYFNTKKEKRHILIPIPISKKKRRKRGFNQSEILAEALSQKTEIPVQKNILLKKFHTLSQVETKSRLERIKNMKNSFYVSREDGLSVYHNHIVILIDDIITTGATINEAARVLKKAGFKNVMAVTAARG